MVIMMMCANVVGQITATLSPDSPPARSIPKRIMRETVGTFDILNSYQDTVFVQSMVFNRLGLMNCQDLEEVIISSRKKNLLTASSYLGITSCQEIKFMNQVEIYDSLTLFDHFEDFIIEPGSTIPVNIICRFDGAAGSSAHFELAKIIFLRNGIPDSVEFTGLMTNSQTLANFAPDVMVSKSWMCTNSKLVDVNATNVSSGTFQISAYSQANYLPVKMGAFGIVRSGTGNISEIKSVKLMVGSQILATIINPTSDSIHFPTLNVSISSSSIADFQIVVDYQGQAGSTHSFEWIGCSAEFVSTGLPATVFSWTLIGETITLSGLSTSIEAPEFSPKLKLYPNPATNWFSIESAEKVTAIELINQLGQTVLSTEKTDQIDISHLPSGVYIVKVKDGLSIGSTKLIKLWLFNPCSFERGFFYSAKKLGKIQACSDEKLRHSPDSNFFIETQFIASTFVSELRVSQL